MGNKFGKLRSHTSGNLVYCEIGHKEWWTKGTTCNSWSLRLVFYPIDRANINVDCLENQFRAHDLCDCDHRRHVEAEVKALLATVDEDAPVKFRSVTSQNKHNP
jgi:hypothetical protein